MDDEYEALIEKKVWEVVLPPPDTNIVGSRWTHICKHNEDRTARAKSRVVAQGFTQTLAGACGLRPHPSGASRKAKSRYAPLRPKGRPHNAHLQCKGKPLLHSASTQECILTISAHDPRSKSRYACLRPKCKASQCSSLYHLDPHLCFWQDGGLLICLQR